MRIPPGICAEVPPEDNLERVTQRHYRKHQEVVQGAESRDHRGRGIPGSHSSSGEYSTVHGYSTVRGNAQEQKRVDDFRQARESEVQIREPKFLVQRILCGYGRKE